MALLYGRAGRLTVKNGGFRPGQETDFRAGGLLALHCLLSFAERRPA